MALARLDAVLPADPPTELLLSLHAGFIGKYGDDPDEYEYAMSEFLRMNGMYWGVAAMDLMGRLNNMDRGKIIEFLVACQDPQSGGFRPVQGHDPHILNTLSAVQVAVTLDCLDQLDTEGVVRYVVARQQEDGSFTGDRFGLALRHIETYSAQMGGERQQVRVLRARHARPARPPGRRGHRAGSRIRLQGSPINTLLIARGWLVLPLIVLYPTILASVSDVGLL